MQEPKRALRAHGVASLEELDFRALRQAELGVEPTHLGVLVRHPGVGGDQVVMPALHHEGARENQGDHLRVVKGGAQVPVGHLPLVGGEEPVGKIRRRHLARPLVEVPRADDRRVVLQQGRNPHRRLPAVAQAVEANPRTVHLGQGLQPVEQGAVTGDDEGEKRAPHRVGLAVQPAVALLPPVEVVRGQGDETPTRQHGGHVGVTRFARVDGVARQPVPTMLADHHRPAFARLQVLGQHEGAPGEESVVHIQHHVPGNPVGSLRNLAGARPGRHGRLVKSPHGLARELLAQRLAVFDEPGRIQGGVESLGGPSSGAQQGLGSVQEGFLPHAVRCPDELLHVVVQLLEQALVAGLWGKARAGVGQERGRGRVGTRQQGGPGGGGGGIGEK